MNALSARLVGLTVTEVELSRDLPGRSLFRREPCRDSYVLLAQVTVEKPSAYAAALDLWSEDTR